MWFASLLVVAGCHRGFNQKKSPTSAPVFSVTDDFDETAVRSKMPQLSQTYQQTPLVAPVTPALAVAEGSLPLVYLAAQGGSMRIVDQTDKSVVLSQDVVANTIIAVDAARGVSVGGKRVINYPLAAEHRYAIYLDSDSGPSVFQRGMIRPGAPAPGVVK